METGKRKRSGSEKRQRHPRVSSRVNDEELALIATAAAAQGLSVSGYIRWLAFNHPKTRAVRRPLADVILLAQLRGEAGRVDGNLAQLLRIANRGEMVMPAELGEAMQAVRNFWVRATALLTDGLA